MAGKTYTRKSAPMTLSFDPETNDRLRRFAVQRHNSVSQLVSDWIWDQPVDGPEPPKAADGQARGGDAENTVSPS